MKLFNILVIVVVLLSCKQETIERPLTENNPVSLLPVTETSLVILGTIQDAGSPHIACKKDCCVSLFGKTNVNRKVVSLGIVDPESQKSFLLEATPDIGSTTKKNQWD